MKLCYDHARRVEKLTSKTEREQRKLIYEWIKTGRISFREFEVLLKVFVKGD